MTEEKDIITKEDAESEIKKAKGKRGFQKGNKLASKAVKRRANKIDLPENVLQNPQSTVIDILHEKGISAASEMIKAARQIKEPEKKFKAWKDIHSFIEGQRKAVDISVNKREEKHIIIKYEKHGEIEHKTKRQPFQKVKNEQPEEVIPKVVETEFKKLTEEIEQEVMDEIDSENSD